MIILLQVEDSSFLSPISLPLFSIFLTLLYLPPPVPQILIPISLYISIELVKIGQVFFITNDIDLYDEETDSRIQCKALNITEDLGQIEYIFSDKTGTLTENKMVFRRCSIVGNEYPHKENGKPPQDLLHTCIISQITHDALVKVPLL